MASVDLTKHEGCDKITGEQIEREREEKGKKRLKRFEYSYK